MTTRWRAFRAWLPTGSELPLDEWAPIHRAITAIVWVHVLALLGFGLWMGLPAPQVVGEAAIVAGLGAVASWGALSRRFRGSVASVALLTSSAIFVQFSGGYIEAHFHFFVVLAVVAVYQDWTPFLIGVAYVALDHGIVGALFPTWVYNHPDAIAHPWKWALLHAGLVLAEGSALIGGWRIAEAARARSLLVLRSAGDAMLGIDTRGRITFANPSALSFLDAKEDALIGHALRDLVDARDGEGRPVALDRPPEDGAVHRGEASLALGSRDASVEWVSAPILRSGTTTGFVLTLKEVTERRRAEDEARLMRELSLAVAEAASFDDAIQVTLTRICEAGGWVLGQAWTPTPTGDALTCHPAWHGAGGSLEPFRAASESIRFPPGVGIPGRVWSSGEPAWSRDVRKDSNFSRAATAIQVGIAAGLTVPVSAEGRVIAVLEFFDLEERDGDARMLDLVRAVTTPLGIAALRKQGSDALRASEAKFRAVFDTATDAIVAADARGLITYCNRAAESTFGYEPEGLVGKPIAVLMPPSYHDRHREGFARYLRTRHPRVMGKTLELEGRRRDGTHFPLEITISTWTVGGDPFFTAIMRDVTERVRLVREREQALEAVKRTAASLAQAQHVARVGSWDWDMVSNTVTWSDELYRIYGLDPRKFEATFEAVLALIHPDDRELFNDAVARSAKSHEPFRLDHRIVHPDWTARWLHAQGAVEADGSGRAIRMHGTAEDITGRKIAELGLRASLAEKEALLKEIHHRVKNNLQITSALLLLQSTKARDEATRELFMESMNRIKSIALVHEKLYDSKSLANIDFAWYANDLTSALIGAYGAPPNVSVEMDVQAVEFDTDTSVSLGLILNELVSNVLKHAFPDGRTGRIWISLVRNDPDQFSLCVRDDGVGLAPGFDADRSMGLRLVAGLARQVNGSLTLDRDHGTEVRVTFHASHAIST